LIGLKTAYVSALDSVNHRFFVGDTGNSRVLVYNLDSNNNLVDKTPDFVLGQVNFTANAVTTTQSSMNGVTGMAYDSDNQRLFVAQNSNRVTVFDVTTITNNENAVNVLGQINFTNSSPAITQSGMNDPYGIAYDSINQRLFVAQNGQHRVMVYDH
jgi:DNA-binding beta-propeller fold protein YncE